MEGFKETLVNIPDCSDCPLNNDSYSCNHPKAPTYPNNVLVYHSSLSFPEWCPLPEYPVIIISRTLASKSTTVL